MLIMTLSGEGLGLLLRRNMHVMIVSVLSVGVTFFLSKFWRRKRSTDKSDIPGHLGLPVIGETFSFLSATNSTKGCYDFVRLRRVRHGKWFKTSIFGKTNVFVPSTDGARMVYANEFIQFTKGFVKPLADVFGEKSLTCVPHQSHKRIRRLLSDPFSMHSLSKFVKKFDLMLCKTLKKQEQSGKSFVLLRFSTKMTFDAICAMLMSVTDESLLQQMEKDCMDISAAMLSFPVMIPGSSYYKGFKARESIMRIFRDMIARRRSGKEVYEDFLQTMLQRDSYPPEEKLDDSEIMDNLLTLILAGQDTTAAAMMWSVKFLDENREAQDRLREETMRIAKNKKGEPLGLEDVNSMAYGLKVVKETLRMCNVVMWLPRVALNDCNIEGFKIKKGWHVNIDATCIHYDPVLYKDPTLFNPSRFETVQKPYSFLPFGSGPRTCLGMDMAKIMFLVFLLRLASGYKWVVDNQDPSLEKKSLIPRLRSACPITLKASNNE